MKFRNLFKEIAGEIAWMRYFKKERALNQKKCRQVDNKKFYHGLKANGTNSERLGYKGSNSISLGR